MVLIQYPYFKYYSQGYDNIIFNFISLCRLVYSHLPFFSTCLPFHFYMSHIFGPLLFAKHFPNLGLSL